MTLRLTWTEHRYGSGWDAHVGRVGSLTVFWDACRPKDEPNRPPPYKVHVFGSEMKRRFDDATEAQEYAERVAATWLSSAWAMVRPPTPPVLDTPEPGEEH